MRQMMFGVCFECGGTFEFARGGDHAPSRKYCKKCDKPVKARQNRERVARCRAKAKAVHIQPKKQTKRKTARPAPVGETITKKVTSVPPDQRGLYATEKQPTKRAKRAKVGLPNEN